MKKLHIISLIVTCFLSIACNVGESASAQAIDPASSTSATQPSRDTPVAASSDIAQQHVPSELRAFVPPDMKLLLYKTTGTIDGADAVAILERQKRSASDPDITMGQRLLLVLRRDHGTIKEMARNDKIIGCSTCGEDMDDPFIRDGIELKPGHLRIEQDHGSAPSTAIYKFMYDPKIRQWIVNSAINTHVEQSPIGTNFIKSPQELRLPDPPLLANFNPEWRVRQFWNAVVVNDKTHEFSLPAGEPDEHSLNKNIQQECQARGVCHVLVKQLYGCVSLIQDQKGNSFPGASLDRKNGRVIAEANAMQKCTQNGNGNCKVAAYTHCTIGYK